MIFTSYFANIPGIDPGRRLVSIARKTPPGVDVEPFPPLFPSPTLLSSYKNGKVDIEEYERIYREETLAKLNPKQIKRDLSGAVLLCYEKAGDFCHRNIVRKWLAQGGAVRGVRGAKREWLGGNLRRKEEEEMKAICWDDEIEFDKLSLYHAPYYVMGFHRKPQIRKESLELTGATLQPGDEIACITGKKSSAGFEMLCPAAPVKFHYIGIHYAMSGGRYVLWLPSENGKAQPLPHPDYAEVYFGHAYFGDGNLLFALPSGGGRVIESDEVYFNQEELPEHILRWFSAA